MITVCPLAAILGYSSWQCFSTPPGISGIPRVPVTNIFIFSACVLGEWAVEAQSQFYAGSGFKKKFGRYFKDFEKLAYASLA
jgi:hypothetical protein